MDYITVIEYQKIPRGRLPTRSWKQLQSLDEAHATRPDRTVFDWSRREIVVAKNQVGVMQVPGVQVEILPKIDVQHSNDQEPAYLRRAQQNLLYMLNVAGQIDHELRDDADQDRRRAPLLEVLIGLFADGMMRELRRGVYRTYVNVEDELSVVRGRLLLQRQIQCSMGRMEKQHVAFDEFKADNRLNQILKATCRALLQMTRAARTLTYLREALIELDDVDDVVVPPHWFDHLHLDRSSQRYEKLLRFARIILGRQTLSMSCGSTKMFSLLFPMEVVFEQFVGNLIRRHAERWGLPRQAVRLQSRAQATHLLRDEQNRPSFKLKPDIMVQNNEMTHLIIDTKWKRLLKDAEDRKNGVSQADLYQLYAYASRYQCPQCILLYPLVDGATGNTYSPEGSNLKSMLQMRLLNLNLDLPRHLDTLLDALGAIITPAAIESHIL